jgi:hypothetical protein
MVSDLEILSGGSKEICAMRASSWLRETSVNALNSTSLKLWKQKSELHMYKLLSERQMFLRNRYSIYTSTIIFSVSTMLMRDVQNCEITTVGQEFGKMRRATSCEWHLPISRLVQTFCKFLHLQKSALYTR